MFNRINVSDSKQFQLPIRTLITSLNGMDKILKLATFQKLDAITLFQTISGFKNPSNGSGRDRPDLQTGKLK